VGARCHLREVVVVGGWAVPRGHVLKASGPGQSVHRLVATSLTAMWHLVSVLAKVTGGTGVFTQQGWVDVLNGRRLWSAGVGGSGVSSSSRYVSGIMGARCPEHCCRRGMPG
jgi:hypothetical protein